jgi:DNA-binding FadR family transcriptional regulator
METAGSSTDDDNKAPAVRFHRPDPFDRAMLKQPVMVAREIVNYIVDENLLPGHPLPTEREMVEQFGHGRNTIREALRLLETRGVITIRSGRGGGPVVRLPRSSDLGDALMLLLQFQKSTLDDVIEARLLIEPLAASAAAESINPTGLDELQRTVDRMLSNPADDVTFTKENNQFHSLIGRSLTLPVIGIFMDSLKSVQDGVAQGVRYTPERIKAIARAHQKVIDEIAARNSVGAAEAMTQHLKEGQRYWATKFPHISKEPLRWLGD